MISSNGGVDQVVVVGLEYAELSNVGTIKAMGYDSLTCNSRYFGVDTQKTMKD